MLLTLGYMLSRGLAKSGSHDPYTEAGGLASAGESLGDRVKAAAHVLKEGEGRSATTETMHAPGDQRGYPG